MTSSTLNNNFNFNCNFTCNFNCNFNDEAATRFSHHLPVEKWTSLRSILPPARRATCRVVTGRPCRNCTGWGWIYGGTRAWGNKTWNKFDAELLTSKTSRLLCGYWDVDSSKRTLQSSSKPTKSYNYLIVPRPVVCKFTKGGSVGYLDTPENIKMQRC